MSSHWGYKFLFDLAERNWHKWQGIVFSSALAMPFESFLLKTIGASPSIHLTIYSITLAAIVVTWLYSNRYPKTKKGKVGFVVCIRCSNDDEIFRIREDFVDTVRNLLKQGSAGSTFQFMEMPRHIAEKINDLDDAYVLKAKTKAHFVIFGRVRLRKLKAKDYHVIHLEGIVAHEPLPIELSHQLSKEFSELFPKRINIPTEDDLLSFNFTSDWTECVSKYIIGIAAACSHNLAYAELLFQDVHDKLRNVATDFPVFNKLKQRLPLRFSEINEAVARTLLDHWRKTHDQDSLSQFSERLNRIPVKSPETYSILLLRSIEAFLNGRRTKKSLEFARQCKKFDDPIWHFNLAFLIAYEGDLYKAIREYRLISKKYDLPPRTLSEVEEFIVWILEVEPEKYQFYYCLGFFNWKIKGDLEQAKKDFNEFLKYSTEAQFLKEVGFAAQWIDEIDSEIEAGRG